MFPLQVKKLLEHPDRKNTTCCYSRALYRNHYLFYKVSNVPIVHLGVWGMVVTVLSLGFAIGVIIAVGMLFVVQVKYLNTV